METGKSIREGNLWTGGFIRGGLIDRKTYQREHIGTGRGIVGSISRSCSLSLPPIILTIIITIFILTNNFLLFVTGTGGKKLRLMQILIKLTASIFYCVQVNLIWLIWLEVKGSQRVVQKVPG